MYTEKFIDSFNEGFGILLNDQIIEDIKYIEECNDIPTQIGVEKNFTDNTYKIALLYFNDNGYFNTEKLIDGKLKENAITQVKIFENKNLYEESYYFDTTKVENSYDEIKEIRDEIIKNFKNWDNYDENFLNFCIDSFDGDYSTLLNGISITSEDKMNSLICHIYPNGNFETHKKIIERLCNLYNLTTTDTDKSKLNYIIEKISPILSCTDTKLSFEISHDAISLIIHPMVNLYRHKVFHSSTIHLVNAGFLDPLSANQLNSWQTEINSRPINGRLKGYLKIKLSKEDYIKVKILSVYGVI
jgi:hypothetical protein